MLLIEFKRGIRMFVYLSLLGWALVIVWCTCAPALASVHVAFTLSLPRWSAVLPGSHSVRQHPSLRPSPTPSVSGSSFSVVGGPTLSAPFVNRVLAAAGSPAEGLGQVLYDLSMRYGIDDAYALATFWHESSMGKAGMAAVTHSLGNLRCIDGAACYQGYASFPTWEQGFEAFYTLIAGPLYVGDGRTTVAAIIPRYAPAADHNDETAYIQAVQSAIRSWRNGSLLIF